MNSLRTIYDVTFNLDYTNIIDPRIPLITDTLLAGYDCLSNRDFSGRGNHFTWNGGYNAQGAILLNDSNHIIQTPVIERDEMTVIGCWNLAANANNASLVNNLDTSSASYRGGRISKLSGGIGQFDIATGNAGSLNSISTGVAGGWTVRAWSWNSTTLREILHSGSVGSSVNMSARAKNVSRGYSVNGVPAGVSGGSISAGAQGTLGFLLFYNEFMDLAVAKSRMDTVATIISGRGQFVP